MNIASSIQETIDGPTVFITITDDNNRPILEQSEDEWKVMVKMSWEMITKAKKEMLKLQRQGKFKPDPFLIAIDTYDM